MRRALGVAELRRLSGLAQHADGSGYRKFLAHRRDQAEISLPPAGEFRIDFREQLGVEQRAVLGPRELSMP